MTAVSSDPAPVSKPATALSLDAMKAMIGRLVLGELGKVDRFLGIKVHQLWDNHFRVNVVVGTDVGHGRIGRSYFLVFDDAGDMVSSTPSLVAAS